MRLGKMRFRGNVDRDNEFRGNLTRGNEISGYCNFGKMRIDDEIVTLTSGIHQKNISKDHKILNYFFLNNTIFPDGHTLIESLSILHYLEETRPQRALMPQDVHKRAKVREICEVSYSQVTYYLILMVFVLIVLPGNRHRHSTPAKPHSAHSCGRREETRMGPTLDNARLSGGGKTLINVSW
jgi:hypothetical protein